MSRQQRRSTSADVQPRRARSAERHQKGMAIGEMLVLTLPLCVLCMAVASRLTATSSARIAGQWQVAARAQQATRGPCGIGDTDWLMTAPVGAALLNSEVSKAKEPLLLSLLPVPNILPFVSKKQQELSAPVPGYTFKPLADQFVGDNIQTVEARALFVCNEPENGDSRRLWYELPMIGLGLWQAAELFGSSSGGGSGQLPDMPDWCGKGGEGGEGGSGGPSACDVVSSGQGGGKRR